MSASSPDTRHYLFSDIYTHITMTNVITLYPAGTESAGPRTMPITTIKTTMRRYYA
jgi:hypothetical protein